MKRLFLNLTLTNPRLEKEIRETIIAQSNRSQRRERQDIYPLLEKSWLLARCATRSITGVVFRLSSGDWADSELPVVVAT